MMEGASKKEAVPVEVVSNPAIRDLKEPIEGLLKSLSEHIEKGDYGTVIGDDASGRIPALIFDKFIKARYAKLKHPAPQTLFVAGSRELSGGDEREKKQGLILDFLEKAGIKNGYTRRVLIVTDTIASGKSLEPLAGVLKQLGIEFDIATIGYNAVTIEKDGALKEETIEDVESRLGGKIYYRLTHTPAIYGQTSLSGVFKRDEALHSEPAKKHTALEPADFQERLKRARKDAGILAKELSEEYKKDRDVSK